MRSSSWHDFSLFQNFTYSPWGLVRRWKRNLRSIVILAG
jgi:hypothetical protein